MVFTSAGSDSKPKERQGVYDVKKGLLALASHPTEAGVLFKLQDDSSVSASSLNASQRSLTQLWTLSLRGSPSALSKVCSMAWLCSSSGPRHLLAAAKIVLVQGLLVAMHHQASHAVLLVVGTADGLSMAFNVPSGKAAQSFLQYDAGTLPLHLPPQICHHTHRAAVTTVTARPRVHLLCRPCI